MKVIILKSRLSHLGGLERYTTKLASHFAQGAEVTILTSGDTPGELKDVNIVSLTKDLKPTFYHLLNFDKACLKWLEGNRYNVVFGMERNSFQTHYRAGSGVHAAYLKQRELTDPFLKRLLFPLNPLHRTILSLEKKCFENPRLQRLFTNSKMVKEEILSLYNTAQEKIEVIYNGAPYSEWEESFLKTFSSKKSGPFEFLFLGHGFRRKGLTFLLKGLSFLANEDFHLSVVGADKDLTHFKKMAEGLNVTFYGSQKDIIPFYQKADALVIPSIYDPCANVTMEALAMGLFVVTSRFNGASEILNPSMGHVIENLEDGVSVANSLKIALTHPKTPTSAEFTRKSVKELDFSTQLDKIVRKTLL